MILNLLESFFSDAFARQSKTSVSSSVLTKETHSLGQQPLSQFDHEMQSLVEHYDIKKESQQRVITTTLNELESVVYKERRRSDAYSKLIKEIAARYNTTISIINSRNNKKVE